MKKKLTNKLIISLILLLISLASFNWQIDDPSGQLEAGAVYWGFPLPWIKTGPFYAGYLGEYIKRVGVVQILDEGGLSQPRPLLIGLILDLVFYLGVVLMALRLIDNIRAKFTKTTFLHDRH